MVYVADCDSGCPREEPGRAIKTISGPPAFGCLLRVDTVTLPELSHRAFDGATGVDTLPAMQGVLIRIDGAGETPLLVDENETLCPGPGVRWRFVCEVEDRAQGPTVVERLKDRPEYWNSTAT